MVAHRCMQADAICGIALDESNKYDNGLWSVYMTNALPNKYWWNFCKPNTIAKASLSNWEYRHSAGANIHDTKAIGCSVLPSKR